jgi:hypothetical protein
MMDIKKRVTAAQKRVQKFIDTEFAKLAEETKAAFEAARQANKK